MVYRQTIWMLAIHLNVEEPVAEKLNTINKCLRSFFIWRPLIEIECCSVAGQARISVHCKKVDPFY